MKRLTSVLLICIILFSFTSCANTQSTEQVDDSSEESSVNVDDYKKMVSSCVDEISDNYLLLGNAASYMYSYWQTLNDIGGRIQYDELFPNSEEWLVEETAEDADFPDYAIGDIAEQHNVICSLYKDIVEVEVAGTEAEEIFDQISNLFEAYTGFYLMVTEPSGTLSDFSTNYNQYISQINTTNSTLSVLLS